MAKLKLAVDPTFRAQIAIPVAGADPIKVGFTFKHRTTKQLAEFSRSRADKSDIDTLFEMVDGWDLDYEFTRQNAELLLENYGGSAVAIYQGYIDELLGARRKN